VKFAVWQENETVILQVLDTGMGFNPDQVEQLFNRFYRSNEARANFEGNGLGLSIVQSILEHYGANIVAESAGIGLGATFTVHVPVLAQA
jgi:signal transduction histidine kinase